MDFEERLGFGLDEYRSRYGLDVGLVYDAREIADQKVRAAAESRRRSSWVDGQGKVVIYVPNMQATRSSMDSAVAYAVISEKGLEGLLGRERYEDLCQRLAAMSGVSLGDSFGMDEVVGLGRDYLNGLVSHKGDAQGWDQFLSSFADVSGMRISSQMSSSLRASLAFHESLRQKLEGHVSERYASMGTVSDAYMRLGYPAFEVTVGNDYLERFSSVKGHDLSALSRSALSDVMQDPLCVFRCPAVRPESAASCLAVSGYRLPDGGLLGFYLPSPEDVSRGFERKGWSQIRCLGMASVSDLRLVKSILKEDSLRYLKPVGGEDGTSFVVSKMLSKMEGKDPKELSLKGDDGSSPDISPMIFSRHLNTASNIVNNFRNPMSSKRYKYFYGASRAEVASMRRTDTMIGMLSSAPTTGVRKEVVNKERPSFKQRLQAPLTKEWFSAALLKKFEKAGVSNAGHLISIGEEGVREKFGLRAAKSVSAYLDASGLSYRGVRKYAVVTMKSVADMTVQEKEDLRFHDFHKALSGVPDRIEAGSLGMPRDAAGVYFSGVNAAALVSRLSYVERWQGCNVFLDADDLRRYSLEVSRECVPCHLAAADGSLRTVFNLADTSLAKEHALYERVVRDSLAQSVAVPAYLTTILPNVKVDDYIESRRVYDFLDHAYRSNIKNADLGVKPQTLDVMLERARAEEKVKDRVIEPSREVNPVGERTVRMYR
jgi:hypothetical protein